MQFAFVLLKLVLRTLLAHFSLIKHSLQNRFSEFLKVYSINTEKIRKVKEVGWMFFYYKPLLSGQNVIHIYNVLSELLTLFHINVIQRPKFRLGSIKKNRKKKYDSIIDYEILSIISEIFTKTFIFSKIKK